MRPQVRSALALCCALVIALVAYACLEHPEASMQPSEAVADAAAPAILLAVGDIAGCKTWFKDEETAELVASLPGTVAALGDVVYEDAYRWQFNQCYDPSWGRVLSRTRPAVGNHEYRQVNASTYYEYFGTRAGPAGKGYYTYKLGTWRVYVLNSERLIPEQTIWLTAQLAANPSKCILAYWHKPLYTSGSNPNELTVRPLWDALYKAGAEVVLSGHNHNYERFAPQDADGNFQAKGVRQFVIGTGGAQLEGFETIQPNSKLRYVEGWGVLRLSLGSGKYGWNFLPIPGSPPADTGSANCT
jgi:acid phosphatase type 7